MAAAAAGKRAERSKPFPAAASTGATPSRILFEFVAQRLPTCMLQKSAKFFVWLIRRSPNALRIPRPLQGAPANGLCIRCWRTAAWWVPG